MVAWGSDKCFCLPRAGCRANFLTDLVQVRKWNKNGFVNGEQQANMKRGLLRIFFSETTPTLVEISHIRHSHWATVGDTGDLRCGGTKPGEVEM